MLAYWFSVSGAFGLHASLIVRGCSEATLFVGLWSFQSKTYSRTVKNISEVLISFASSIPSEFQRKPRSLSDLKHWKATEYRLFLLYVGPVVMMKFLIRDLYQHFLLLSSALRILCSNLACDPEHNLCARNMLLEFVKLISVLYSPDTL